MSEHLVSRLFIVIIRVVLIFGFFFNYLCVVSDTFVDNLSNYQYISITDNQSNIKEIFYFDTLVALTYSMRSKIYNVHINSRSICLYISIASCHAPEEETALAFLF